MKNKQLLLAFAILVLVSCGPKTDPKQRDILFDFDWKFALHDQSGAEIPDYDDTNWRSLNIPHDFSIEQPFVKENPSEGGGAFAFGGIGWYRKHFVLDADTQGKRVTIRFNGVYRNSDVWINGHHLGFRPYGYSTFTYDLTPYLNQAGTANALAVKVNTTEQPNSRWYTGAGIYRHVWLHVSDKTHLPYGGVFVRTSEVKNGKAKLQISAEVACDSTEKRPLQIRAYLADSTGKVVAKWKHDIKPKHNSTTLEEGELMVSSPILWDIENPYLYKLTCLLVARNEVLDSYSFPFGIRTFEWNADKGFLLNGKHVVLKGTNNHHDGGPLGAACADYTFERQIQILKSMGSNALRMSHNPPAPELLEYADKMGMLVIDEIFDEWSAGKRKVGYSPYFEEWYARDIADWMRRDRNHACVVAWSLGNEVPEQRMGTKGVEVLKKLLETARKHDVSRPFTAACNEMPDANASGFAELLDLVGYNYREPMYKSDHERYPKRVIYGSETVMYPYHPGTKFPLRSYEDWIEGQTKPYVAGEFLWTGFDYLGEAGIGGDGYSYEPWAFWPQWPWRSAVCGVVDLCGFERGGYWFRKALWSDEPVLHIEVPVHPLGNNFRTAPFWGWPLVQPQWNHSTPGEVLTVQVYTNCTEVELLLNGNSLGTKKWDLEQEAFLTWDVPYAEGMLEARGKTVNGNEKKVVLKTAGNATKMVLTSERKSIKANQQDVSYLKCELFDENDNPVPFAKNTIQFTVKGAGKLLAVGNGDPASHTPFNGSQMECFGGKCLAIVQAGNEPGMLEITASSDGIKPVTIQLDVK